jgi:hypothetical protein
MPEVRKELSGNLNGFKELGMFVKDAKRFKGSLFYFGV